MLRRYHPNPRRPVRDPLYLSCSGVVAPRGDPSQARVAAYSFTGNTVTASRVASHAATHAFWGATYQRRLTHHPGSVREQDHALSINQAGRARRLEPTTFSSPLSQLRDGQSC